MEGSSGLIVAFVVVLWAAYFVPLALRRYDEISKNESVDAGASRKTLTAVRAEKAPVARVSAPAPNREPVAERPKISRQATVTAARRRRNTLLTLVAALLLTGGVSAAGLISWWYLAAPVLLIATWLVACRIMVREELGLGKMSMPTMRSAHVATDEEFTEEINLDGAAPSRAGLWLQRAKVKAVAASTAVAKATAKKPVPVTGVDAEATIVVSDQFEEYDPDVRHVMEKDVPLGADALDEQLHIAVPSASVASGEPLWDPLPVTVPTYVTKPRAGRTVRTIDFSQPGTWTSGHVEGEQTELPLSGHRDEDGTGEHRKAVGH